MARTSKVNLYLSLFTSIHLCNLNLTNSKLPLLVVERPPYLYLLCFVSCISNSIKQND
ncbi:hypothetical protein OIU77_017520 [Salix suchowensis]|uniref:Uncharacterized protein n=1 Tax=Salix suchowensis TaxID=1278906 RepID=A0ABQ8ZP07_9ROSI|nr:hypothetical protein OIU77_017520 [Salix suchowensis]